MILIKLKNPKCGKPLLRVAKSLLDSLPTFGGLSSQLPLILGRCKDR